MKNKMSRFRDNLLNASQQNNVNGKRAAQEDAPTLVTDIAGTTQNTVKSPEEDKAIEQGIENKKVEIPEEEKQISKDESDSKKNSTVKRVPSNTSEDAQNAPDSILRVNSEEEVEKQEKKKSEPNKQSDVSKKSKTSKTENKKVQTKKEEHVDPQEEDLYKKYESPDETISLLLPPAVKIYLDQRPVQVRKTTKKFFIDIMIKEIESGENGSSDELAANYRKRQQGTSYKSIRIPSKLIEAVKETAANYGMRYTPFMAYTLDKAMQEDKEWIPDKFK